MLALNAATGALKWKHQPLPKRRAWRESRRDVADGKVFSLGRRQHARRAGSRKTVLTVVDGACGRARHRRRPPPIYHDGLVYIGVSGGEAGVRGFFGAFDAKTGKQVWGFWLVPGPGEPGHDTWEGDSWMRGGAPVWTHPAIDPALGMVYIAYRQCLAGLRRLRARRRQSVHLLHRRARSEDRRIQVALPGSASRRLGLRQRGVARPRRHPVSGPDAEGRPCTRARPGFLYILDRTNGKPLVGIEERDVPQEPRIKTAQTQPFPIGDSFVPTCPEPGSVPAG